jgi:hypothetical protein
LCIHKLLTPSEIVENVNANFQENQRQRQNGQFEQGGSNIMQISSKPTGPESGMFMDNPNVSPNQVEIVSGNVVDIPLNQDILSKPFLTLPGLLLSCCDPTVIKFLPDELEVCSLGFGGCSLFGATFQSIWGF